MTILGISIGTTQTGVCVLKESELINWQIHEFKHEWSEAKLYRIIQQYKRYIARHNVNAIMVKIPPTSSVSKPLAQIQKRLVVLAKKHNCKIDFILKSEIKDRLILENTEEIIQLAVRKYPVLQSIYEKGSQNNHSYYRKFYEAILGAHIYTILHPTTK